jgi:carotenoid cleavage dioxygenase-like enzyme
MKWWLITMAMAATLYAQESPMDQFEQLLPRGRIAAITEPVYVSADKAEIAPDSWVLGVVIDGQARAYSLNLLNAHEVVNDEINGKPFAAVW